MPVIVALLAGALVPGTVGPTATVPPADAHSCASPVKIEVGQASNLTIGVPAEAAPVTDVRVRVPDGFAVQEVPPVEGWTAERDDRTVRWRGGALQPFGCGYFNLRGRATERARLVFPLTTRAADGTTKEYTSTNPGAQNSAQLVYAGVDPAEDAGVDAGDSEETTSSLSGPMVGGLVVLGVGLFGGGAWGIRRYGRGGRGVSAPRRPPPRPGAARGPGRPSSGSSRQGSRTRKRPRRR